MSRFQGTVKSDQHTDHHYMAHALKLARQGLYTTDPNPRVGCVVVKDGQIVGEGFHVRAGELHAERIALADAGTKARGATTYVTLEPCCHYGRTPPCTEALMAADVARVVIAMQDPNPRVAGQGIQQLQQAGIQVNVGLLAQAAHALNPGFIRRMQVGKPYVRLKLAMSLDGRTAMASGESRWITDAAARLDVHRLRARSSAIITGINTVLADDPAMTVRLPMDEVPHIETPEQIRQPLRVVLDTQGKMPANAKLLNQPGETLVLTSNNATLDFTQPNLDTQGLPLDDKHQIDLNSVMDYLAQQHEANEVLLECGATLAGSAIQAGIVDELIVYMAPHLMGDAARGLIRLAGIEKMSDRIQLKLQSVRQIGESLRLNLKIQKKLDA